MKNLKFLFLAIILTYVGTIASMAQMSVLKFNADKTFKIVQFTDIHWVPGNPASEEAKARMNEILEAEKPDLVMYTGDFIYGKPASEALKNVFEPVISRHIPFAVTLGNHDDEQDMNRQQVYEAILQMPGNLTGTVEGLSGLTNFILPIKASDGSKDAALLYGLDSHAYSPLKSIKGYDWIKPDQIAWYSQNSSHYTMANGGKPLPALAFFHIPVPEYNEAASTEDALLIGIRKEKACAPALNTGFFTAMLQAGDVMATFVGHDHVNDYVTYWKGILLGYGRFTGGATVYHDIPGGNGARIIELSEGQRAFKSWIRLKNNTIVTPIDFPTDFVKE